MLVPFRCVNSQTIQIISNVTTENLIFPMSKLKFCFKPNADELSKHCKMSQNESVWACAASSAQMWRFKSEFRPKKSHFVLFIPSPNENQYNKRDERIHKRMLLYEESGWWVMTIMESVSVHSCPSSTQVKSSHFIQMDTDFTANKW